MEMEIVKYGDAVLRAKGKRIEQVDDVIRQLAEDMKETMYAARGLGLAAQQVGAALQLTVIDVAQAQERPSEMFIDGQRVDLAEHMPLVLLNPELELSQEKENGTEGCLSFPDMSADISRASKVKVSADLLDGGKIAFEATGLLARALQHETDHLHGVLFIDRMNSATKAGLAGKLKRLQRETLEGPKTSRKLFKPKKVSAPGA
jgi:peptide deformylase